MATNVFQEYEGYLYEEDKSPKSIKNYMADLRLFAKWYEREGQSFAIPDVTTQDVVAYRAHMQDLKRKPNTINRALISINLFFRWCFENGKIPRNPAKKVKRVPQVRPAPRHLSNKEENKLLGAVESGGIERDKAIIVLMLNTGLRAGEVCNLTWDAVTMRDRSGNLDIRAGKRNKYRQVPLNVVARTALKEYRQSLGYEPSATSYVFESKTTGESLSPRTLANIIHKYQEKAGIAHLRPHDLRHRFAYRMIQNTPIDTLALIMGHESINTTAVYTKPTNEDLQRAVETIAG